MSTQAYKTPAKQAAFLALCEAVKATINADPAKQWREEHLSAHLLTLSPSASRTMRLRAIKATWEAGAIASFGMRDGWRYTGV